MYYFFRPNWGLAIAITLFCSIAVILPDNAVNSEPWKKQKIANMYARYAQEFPQVPGLTVEEFKQLQQKDKAIVVDVRTLAEREVSMIPGAISQAELEQNLDIYQNYPIVVYCTIGYRSGKYAQKLRQKGLNVFNLEGSLLAWSHVNGELVNSSGKTQKIHVFGRKWQLTADNYQPVW